ncbi:MAG: esterase-like activity of phytase family protein [Pseudomonadota bacterium]
MLALACTLVCAQAVCGVWGAARAAEARLIASLTLDHDDSRFGGLSGMLLGPGGKGLLAVSDRGWFVSVPIRRDTAGLPTGIGPVTFQPILDPDGRPVEGAFADAEGLALLPGGRIAVSFERHHRVWTYSDTAAYGVPLAGHRDFATFQNNSGLEALASTPGGTLLALPERSGALDRPFPIYSWQSGSWDRRQSVPCRGEFLPVGLDIGPDGRLYLLERRYVPWVGFATRVRRFRREGETLVTEETILQTTLGRRGNHEAISVWRTGAGSLRMTLLADDNFNFLQSNELLEYALPE